MEPHGRNTGHEAEINTGGDASTFQEENMKKANNPEKNK